MTPSTVIWRPPQDLTPPGAGIAPFFLLPEPNCPSQIGGWVGGRNTFASASMGPAFRRKLLCWISSRSGPQSQPPSAHIARGQPLRSGPRGQLPPSDPTSLPHHGGPDSPVPAAARAALQSPQVPPPRLPLFITLHTKELLSGSKTRF